MLSMTPLLTCGLSASVLHQLRNRVFHILALRQDEVLQLRGVADEGVGGADAADGGVQVFEKLDRDAGGDLGTVAVRDRIFVSDDDARGFPDGFGDGFPIVWYERAKIDDLYRDALLFEPFGCLVRTLDKRAERDDGNISPLTDGLRLTERYQKIAGWVLRFVVDLAVKMFVFKEHHRVVAADRRSQ